MAVGHCCGSALVGDLRGRGLIPAAYAFEPNPAHPNAVALQVVRHPGSSTKRPAVRRAQFFLDALGLFPDLALFSPWDRRRIAAERIALFAKQDSPATVSVADELATTAARGRSFRG